MSVNTRAGNESNEPTYEVVMNDEGQYSIWLANKSLPLGWRKMGVSGKKPECLEFIKLNWVDLRPLSLRKSSEAAKEVML